MKTGTQLLVVKWKEEKEGRGKKGTNAILSSNNMPHTVLGSLYAQISFNLRSIPMKLLLQFLFYKMRQVGLSGISIHLKSIY